MKKLIAFDLDDTLAVTKSPITERMAGLLAELTKYYEICIISAGRVDQMRSNVVERLSIPKERLSKFHLMTAGTQYYTYNKAADEWQRQYIEALTDEEKARIASALEEGAKSVGMWLDDPAGPHIDDRLSLIAFSALGQHAKPEDKYAWDPDRKKRQKLRAAVAERIPDFEVVIDSTTSLNIMRPGVNKGYGMQKLLEMTGLKKSDVLFIGDQLRPDGNDYAIKQLGIDTIAVTCWQDTALVIDGILGVSGA
ncbi:MAG TPA: HAD-IIB family hydrolase [Candidatus Saccharimonadales bacterium]|nr:HAD-IIB family hydrolase [Candidatus Saccharimonadales bacterium]